MQVFKRHISSRNLIVFGFEAVMVSGSMLLAARVSGPGGPSLGAFWKIVAATALCQLCFYYNDLYELTAVHAKRELFVHILRATGTAALAIAIALLVVPSFAIGHQVFTWSLCFVVLAIPLWRVLFDGLTSASRFEERILILGCGPNADTVSRAIRSQHDYAWRIVASVDESHAADLARLISEHDVNRIVVSVGDRRGVLPSRELLQAKLAGVQVEDATTTYERITGKILTNGLKPSWFIFSDGFRTSRLTRATKRIVDIAVSAVGLVFAAPLMLLTGLLVRLDSKGPMLYRQERVGAYGRPFMLFKFRSMRVDAEGATPVWAVAGDNRVTRVGQFIRMTRLDELPQLWNVLRGDMSLVGPRPERPYFVEQLAAAIPFYAERHAVKPGVTGWAQVKYRYGSTIEDAMEKLRYDLYYIKHQSLVFDLTIAMDTVKVILARQGAR